METRPTADRVREALFNILSARVPGARVLDLFAGSGAMALEAVSRGAQCAVMVDSSRRAADSIRRNTALVRAEDRTRLIVAPWQQALSSLGEAPFDLVFMDPPYRMHESYAQAAQALYGRGLLAPDAVLVLEHERAFGLSLPSPFECYDRRTYGAAAVTLARIASESGE